MKIAVTYENGQVFQHFGRTEQFKVYEVEDGKVVSSRVMSTNGTGHEALADFLAGNDITTVICGGVGGGMMQALNIVGIEVCAGVQGDADEAGGSAQSPAPAAGRSSRCPGTAGSGGCRRRSCRSR